MELEKCFKMSEHRQPKCIENVRQIFQLVHMISEIKFKAAEFQFMVEDRNAVIEAMQLPMLKIDFSDVHSIFVGNVVMIR